MTSNGRNHESEAPHQFDLEQIPSGISPAEWRMSSPEPKSSELKAFLFLTVVMAPVIAGVVIGTYGIAVWIYQMFAGPPTGG